MAKNVNAVDDNINRERIFTLSNLLNDYINTTLNFTQNALNELLSNDTFVLLIY